MEYKKLHAYVTQYYDIYKFGKPKVQTKQVSVLKGITYCTT